MRRVIDSLRGRLLLSGMLGTALAALAVAWGLGAAFERAMIGSFDQRLGDDLLTIASQLTADGDRRVRLQQEPVDSRYARVFSGHYWVVRQGHTVFRSRSLWDSDLEIPQPRSDGGVRFGNLQGPAGQALRSAVQTLRIAGVVEPVQVMVASEVSATRADIHAFRIKSGMAGALAAALLLLVLALLTDYSLRPLRRITAALELLRGGERQHLDVDRMPDEIRPLADELNALLDHHERMVTRARHSAGDLAHALKTPLSILMLAADRPDERLPSLVKAQVVNMTASVDRQLNSTTLADSRSRTPLAPVVNSLLAMLTRLHAGREVRFEAEVEETLCFNGEQADLEDMVGNLADNAGKWARSRVSIAARLADGFLEIEVSDDGPGIPAAELERVVQRGVRLDRQAPGSGLGLSIVSRLTESYGGALRLQRLEPEGFRATLVLPGSRSAGALPPA